MLGFLRLMERIGTGRPLERQIGFCRVAVARGMVAVSGCAPTNPDGSSAGGNAMVVVKELLRPEWLVVIEADAVRAE